MPTCADFLQGSVKKTMKLRSERERAWVKTLKTQSSGVVMLALNIMQVTTGVSQGCGMSRRVSPLHLLPGASLASPHHLEVRLFSFGAASEYSTCSHQFRTRQTAQTS